MISVCAEDSFRAQDRGGIEDNSKTIFSYFAMKTYVVTPH